MAVIKQPSDLEKVQPFMHVFCPGMEKRIDPCVCLLESK
jgi:hypothetical protein